jgi:hypothetical protein
VIAFLWIAGVGAVVGLVALVWLRGARPLDDDDTVTPAWRSDHLRGRRDE